MASSTDLVLVQAPQTYNQSVYARMIDILQQTFSNYTTVSRQAQYAASLLTTNVTPVSNAGALETTLMTYSIVPNTIARTGTTIEIDAFGTLASNANNKQLKLYFGSTVIYDTGSAAANGGSWSFNAKVTTTGINTELAITTFNSSNVSFTSGVNYVMPTESLSAILIIKVTGTGLATNDITENGLLIKFFPNSNL